MSGQELFVEKKKKPRGRPRTGRGHQVNVMLTREVKAALDEYISDRGGHMKATEAIRRLLLESLGQLGYFRH